MLLLFDRTDQYPDWLCLFKSDTPPGARWITVHPNGKEEKGVPVLIQESHTSPGNWHVIAGGDDKLTHLTLDHIGSRADWAARAKAKRDKDKAEGRQASPETREQAKVASKKAKIDFVNKVAEQLGWDKNWYKTAEDYVREDPRRFASDRMAAGIAADKNLKSWHSQAKAAVAKYERRLRVDAEARNEAGLGDLSFNNNPYRATSEDLDAQQIFAKISEHIDASFDAKAEEAGEKAEEASAYEGLVAQLANAPDDASSQEIGALIEGIGQPNTAAAKQALAALRSQDISPLDASRQLQEAANGLRSGDTDLLGGSLSQHHREVADLYRQAATSLRTEGGGGEEEAARYIEQAKKLTGDYEVGAMDLLGQRAKEGKGYKPVERQRARQDIQGKGETAPENIAARIEAVTRHHDELGRDPNGGKLIQEATKRQLAALDRAHEAARMGKLDDAADYIIEAQKEQVWERDLEEKRADVGEDGRPNLGKVAGAVMARERMTAAHATVREAKASSGSGGGGGSRSSGGGGGGRRGGADVSDEALDMSKAVALLKAKNDLKQRERQIGEAKKEAAIDPDAFRTALQDNRIDETPLSDADLRKMIGKLTKLDDARVHSDLINAVEDPATFAARAGAGDQVQAGSIARWVDVGRDAMIQNIARLAGNGLQIDRVKFASLGLKDGCRLLAQHLANTLDAAHLEDTLEGLSSYHSGRAFNVASQAIRAAESCLEQAKEFDVRGKQDSYDLSESAKFNKLRMQAVDQALTTVGTAYGELNANAEMIWALSNARPSADHGYTIRGEGKDREGLVVLARSLGLDEGDYHIQSPKYDPISKQARPGYVGLTPGAAPKLFHQQGAHEAALENSLQTIKAGKASPDGKFKGDEDGWLPQGIARRPKTDWDDPEKRPDQFSADPAWGGVDFGKEEGDNALRDHIGQRLADGMPVEQLVAEMRDPRMMAPYLRSGQHGKFSAAVDRLVPADPDHTWRQRAHEWAGEMVRRHNQQTGREDVDLHSQMLDSADPDVHEAAHRALARNPLGTLAFRPVGKLTAVDRAKLRDYAYRNLWGMDPDKPDEAEQKKDTQAPPPQADKFGNIEAETLPQGNAADPRAERWNRYVRDMGGREGAYRALTEHIKGDTMSQFAQTYAQVSGQQLRTGRARMQGGARHYRAHADEATRKRIDDAIASRAQGTTPNQAREQIVARLSAENPSPHSPDRATIGDTAENTLSGMWENASQAFSPGKPVDLSKTRGLSMDGKYIQQQRSIKAIRANKRVVLAMGVGSGKSLISLGAFTDAHHHGDATHALYAVPANMVGQYGSEAATYLDPSKGYKWHAKPGSSAEERQKALGSKDTHFVVTTHESLRDDAIKALAEHKGISVREAEDWMRGPKKQKGQPPPDHDAARRERKDAILAAFKHKGWEHRLQFFHVDEGHKALNRKGKANSLLANVFDAISDNSKHYVTASGTPVKNDLSEAYDMLSKMDGDRYPESARADWLRNNGGVEGASPRIREARQDKEGNPLAGTPNDPKDWTNVALAETYQHAVAPYFYQSRVPLTQPLTRRNISVNLTAGHQRSYDDVTALYARANAAKEKGQMDLPALRALNPSAFEGHPESEHAAIGAKQHAGLAMIRDTAYNRALHSRREGNAKLDKLSELVDGYRHADSHHADAEGKVIKGKPGIVFAHNHESVAAIRARLEKEGHRVGVITGSDDAVAQERTKAGFQPPGYKSNLERGEPHKHAKHDVLVCSDAVSAGADLPRAEWVMNYDIPQTAANHEQRTARAHRLSSEHPVEMTNLISHTPFEQENWFRLEHKYALSDVSQNPAEKADDSGLQWHIAQAQAAGTRRRIMARQGQRRAVS